MKELRTEIEFDGTPEEVWEVLVDLPAYAEWNPFMKKIEGEARAGAKLEVRMKPEGERAMTFRPTVLAAEPERELRWLGHLLAKASAAARAAVEGFAAGLQEQHRDVLFARPEVIVLRS